MTEIMPAPRNSHITVLRPPSIQAKSFLKRITERVDVDNHDMGFLYTPSCVAAYR